MTTLTLTPSFWTLVKVRFAPKPRPRSVPEDTDTGYDAYLEIMRESMDALMEDDTFSAVAKLRCQSF